MRGSHLVSAARGLAVLRIIFGVLLFVAGIGKMSLNVVMGFLPMPMTSMAWQLDLPERLGLWLAAHPAGVMAAIVRDLILPHGALVAGLLAWLQVIVALFMIAGLLTRFAAIGAGILAVMLTLTAKVNPAGGARFYVLLGFIALVMLIGDAGQTWGIDGWRRERKRGSEF